MRQRCYGIRGGTSRKPCCSFWPLTPIFTLQLSCWLDSCSALDWAQLSVKTEMGLQPSVGDFGNYCTLSHLAEVFTKLIWHKQAGEEVQSSCELWFQFSLRGTTIKGGEGRDGAWLRGVTERNNGFLGPRHLFTPYAVHQLWQDMNQMNEKEMFFLFGITSAEAKFSVSCQGKK